MSAILFGSPWAALKSWAGVTPGLRRMNVGPPAGSPVTVDTTLTPPDCSAPPTVIFVPFIVTVITGRAVLCPVWAAGTVWAASAVPPGMASDRPAATRAVVMLLRIAGSPFRCWCRQPGAACAGWPAALIAPECTSRTVRHAGTLTHLGLRGLTARPRPHPPPLHDADSPLTKPHDRRRSPLNLLLT